MSIHRYYLVFILIVVFFSCQHSKKKADQKEYPQITDPLVGAGFRYSAYGPQYNPGRAYWLSVGQRMASKFAGAQGECIWIVGTLRDKGCHLNFPATSTNQHITTASTDENEETFRLFDENNIRVWLQVEPGLAPVEELIRIMLSRYSHHKCIVGVGVDVEWYKSYNEPDGQAVTDAEAKGWLAIAREYHPQYKLFLKHWLIEKMPPTTREGIVFIDDSQELPSLQGMVDEFAGWGRAFAPARVGFQFGYITDRIWWKDLDDPAKTIGEAILANVPNASSLFWVDFTVIEVFPPKH